MKKLLALVLTTGVSLSVAAQSTFQNLDFEDSLIALGTSGRLVPVSSAIPGWTAYIDDNQQSQLYYNDPPPFGSGISLFGSDPSGALPILEGNFSILLRAEGAGNSSISQSAVVPSPARFLLFKTSRPSIFGSPTVTVNGEQIACVLSEIGDTYASFAGEVSRFAGESVNLTFTAAQPTGGTTSFLLDSIEFSSVPEPRINALLALGTVILLLMRRSLRSKSAGTDHSKP